MDGEMTYNPTTIPELPQVTGELPQDALFIVSEPNGSGYDTKSLDYGTLVKDVSEAMDVGTIEAQIAELSDKLNAQPITSYLSDLTDLEHPVPTVISALQENKNGQICGLSGYYLSSAVIDILNTTVLPRVSAETSPWLRQADVVSVSGDSQTKAASQKFATEVQAGLSGKIARIDTKGHLGDVAYATPSGEFNMNPLVDFNYFVCESDGEMDITDALYPRDFETLYTKAGYYDGSWYGYDPEYVGGATPGRTHWALDAFSSSNRAFSQTYAATDYSFICSPIEVDRFSVQVRLSSSAAGYGENGFVAAIAEDEDGTPHTLSFMRKADGTTPTWSCMKDFAEITSVAVPGDLTGGWADFSTGTTVDVERDGDSIVATATAFGGATLTAQIALNLNTPELSVFSGRHKFGFASHDQAGSRFDVISLDFPVVVVNTEDNSAISCYGGNEVQLQSSPMELIGQGRFSHNLATRKTFYVADYGFIRL